MLIGEKGINKLNVLSVVAQPGLDLTKKFKALNGTVESKHHDYNLQKTSN